MFGYYSSPSHFYTQPSSSRPSFYASQPSSCRNQQRYHSSPFSSMLVDDEDEAERYSQAAEYQRYLAAARREQERKEFEAVQARQRAQEKKRAYLQAMARAQAKAEAEARAREQAEARAREEYQARYHRYMQQQAEKRTQARQEQERRQQQRAAYQQELARAFLGQFAQYPSSTTSSSTSAPTNPFSAALAAAASASAAKPQPTHGTFTPAVRPLPAPAQPKMSYMAAVKVIQTLAKQQLSIRRRIKSLHAIQAHFQQLKQDLTTPEALVFDTAKSTSSAPVLAYNPGNRPLQTYEESLTRLLTDLDSIPSEGSHRVRDERKAVATAIEAELSRLDAVKLEHWTKQQQLSHTEEQQQEVIDTEMQDSQEQQKEETPSAAESPVEPASHTVGHSDEEGTEYANQHIEAASHDSRVDTAEEVTAGANAALEQQEQTEEDMEDMQASSQGDRNLQDIASGIPADDAIPSTSTVPSADTLSPESGSPTAQAPHISPSASPQYASSTTLPLPFFGLGMADIMPEQGDLNARVVGDDGSDSDTSFEML